MKRSAQVLSILSLNILDLGLLAQSHPSHLQIDHITVAGRNLKAMRQALESAGIQSEYGGPHANHATEMALVSFPDGSYLELIAIQPKADDSAVRQHAWAKFMNANSGPCAWAIRLKDVSVEATRLRAAGVDVKSPARSGRARPDGYQLDWQTAQVGLDGNGTFFPFLIRDFTPRDKRAFPSGKPSNTEYSGVTGVVLGVRDLNISIARYRKAFDLPEPQRKQDADLSAELALFPGTPVILARPLEARSWLGQRLGQFGEGPCAFILGKPGQAGGAVSWFNAEKLGWRLGVLSGSRPPQ